ncbi:MAG: hypothetical protein R3E64_03745 [Halioglobus sp.]
MPMQDYKGPLREDFQWHHLEKKTMARFAREVMLCNQIHDRALLPLVAGRWGSEAMTAQAIDEWMGSSPVYNARIRALHGITGDGVDVIMKGFQLDIGAPHMWLKFHYDVKSHDLGFFWLTSCGAYNGVRGMTGGDHDAETQICVHMEDPTFDATVMAVNRGARCTPVYRPPHGGEIPAAGPCRWQVSIADHIGLVEENPQTAMIERTRAGQFRFATPAPTGDGLNDYSGDFKPDFRLEDLSTAMLSVQLKEFALDVHLLQRSSYLSVQRRHGDAAVIELIGEHCSGMAPVYQARMRRLFGIEGNDMSAILKLLQLDHHFVPEYVKTGVQLVDEQRGKFWIEDCAAIDDDSTSGILTALWRGKVTGLEQIVQAINPQAVVTAENPEGSKRFLYSIRIDTTVQPAKPSPMSELVGSFGLLDADLSEHIYSYEN